jgi:hypothetical protein
MVMEPAELALRDVTSIIVRWKFHRAPSCTALNLLETIMLGLIARWGHNVLLITTGLLTIAVLLVVK